MIAPLADTDAQALADAFRLDDGTALRQMLERGIEGFDIGYRNEEGCSLVYLAAEAGSLDCLRTLLAAGAPVNVLSTCRTRATTRSALNAALELGHYETAECLLAAGANAKIADHSGNTAIHRVIRGTAPKDDADRGIAGNQWRLAMLEALVQAGCNINQVNHTGVSAFREALNRNFSVLGGDSVRLPLIATLLRLGANPDIEGATGEKSLHRKWTARYLPLMKLLTSHGADVNARDRRGYTPIFHAADLDTVAALIDAGADVNSIDNDGRDLFHSLLADPNLSEVHEPILVHLLRHGTDPDLPDYTGQTARQLLDGPQSKDAPRLDTLRTLMAARDASHMLRKTAKIRYECNKP